MSGSANKYEFGSFCVDPGKRLILKDGQPLHLAPKAFDTLLLLIQNRDALIEKDALIKTLWPDTFVEEINLTVYISAIRKVLGEGPNDHQYIVTVPKRGYKFVASVTEAQDETSPAGNGLNGSAPNGGPPDAPGPISTSESEPHTEGVSAGNGSRGRRLRELTTSRMKLIGAAAVLTAFVATGLSFYLQKRRRAASPHVYGTIAVLPFQALDPSDEYLTVGMADALIAKLNGLQKFSVRPTSAVRRYAGRQHDALAAGRELGVDTVMDGTVQRAGQNLRITARLTRVRDGKALWAGSFDEKISNILAVQDRISERIALALDPDLGHEEKGRLAKDYTADPEAYDAYLLGLYFWNKRSNDSLKKAIDYFNRAVEKDPSYALAYGAQADCYNMCAYYGFLPNNQAYPLAERAANRALTLDETVAIAHTALALEKSNYEGDWEAAGKELRRALELDPNSPLAHQRYAWYLLSQNGIDAALPEMRRSVQLDPLSLIDNLALAQLLYFEGQYDESRSLCQKVLELDSSFWSARYELGLLDEQRGKFNDALAEIKEAEGKYIDSVEGQESLGEVYAAQGNKTEAEKAIHKLDEISKKHNAAAPFGIALIYAGMHDKEKTLTWLEKGVEMDGIPDYMPRFDPRLKLVRDDPRFEKVNELLDKAMTRDQKTR
ncbi:MAG TPA: winged helix-turn-helix domain-containing protein [Blastocatellia bacterium]|nr:winged helix-turn-helix domain-containing protein [Blastocatellia bacterium]